MADLTDTRRVLTRRDNERALAQEVPVALVFNGGTQAVMMATPQDLEAFGIGFAVSEGIVSAASQIQRIEVVEHERGFEVQMWIDEAQAAALSERRRTMLGPVGCGLCGVDSLDQALRELKPVSGGTVISSDDVNAAVRALRAHQPLHDQTRSVHAAAFWRDGIIAACEDVGRHNALDKLIGSLLLDDIDPQTGVFVITSRVSVDMVQKTVMAGCPILVAVSAPTVHAVDTANAANLTIAALARGDGFDIFTHGERIRDED